MTRRRARPLVVHLRRRQVQARQKAPRHLSSRAGRVRSGCRAQLRCATRISPRLCTRAQTGTTADTTRRSSPPLGEKASERIKTTKAFVDAWRANAADAPGASPMPSFPQPRKPRKAADARLAALSEENVDAACFGAYRGTCVIAVVDAPAGDEFAEHAALVELSKKYRNDPFSFVWIDAAAQRSFARAFGLREGDGARARRRGRRANAIDSRRARARWTSPARPRSSIRFWVGISSSNPSPRSRSTSRSTSGETRTRTTDRSRRWRRGRRRGDGGGGAARDLRRDGDGGGGDRRGGERRRGRRDGGGVSASEGRRRDALDAAVYPNPKFFSVRENRRSEART